MKLIPYAVVWAVMATAVIILAIYRKMIASHEDDSIHLNSDPNMQVSQIARQQAVAEKLQSVDRLGKGLTILVAVSGLILAGVYLYLSWMESYKLPD